MKSGIEIITEERKKQIEVLGHTVELDVKHNAKHQLLDAATRLLMVGDPDREATKDLGLDALFVTMPPEGWGKDHWERMIAKPYEERLVIAGGLIAAEIDRKLAIEIANKPEGE